MKTHMKLAATVVLAAGTLASAQSLTTTLSDNGSGGVFMDLTPTAMNLEVTAFETYFSGTLASTVEVWAKPGTYVGFDASSAGWTLHETVFTTGAGTATLAPINLMTPIPLPAGITTAVYVQGVSGSTLRYTGTSTLPPQTLWSNADISLFSDVARTGSVSFGGTRNSPRTFAGVLHYQVTGPAAPGACCFGNGTCQDLLPVDCLNGGGTYNGAGTECATTACPQPGACCYPTGACAVVSSLECDTAGGIYHGNGTTCATVPTCPHWLTTSYTGGSSASTAGAGAYFNVTAQDPAGIVIEGFDINSPAAAGTAMTVHVYIRPNTHVGFESDPLEWILLGEVPTTAAGLGNPTPVNIGGLHMAQGETWGFRVGAANGGIRYNSTATTTAIHSNGQLQIELGRVQNNFFGTLLSGNPLGWNGSIFYSLGATVTTGACCLPNGTCEEVREVICTGQGGTYHGDNTNCATTPPGGCPQPATGACCLDGGSCIVVWEPDCLAQSGLYQGDGTDCTIGCPLSLTTAYDGGSSATGTNAGAFFNITPLDAAGIVVDGFQINTPAAAGTPITAHVYYKGGPHEGFESDESAWTLLGEAQTISAGLGNRTPVAVGDLHIPFGETWALRVGVASGGIRYNSATTTVPVHSNSHVQLELGRVQSNFFGTLLAANPAGWNGTLFYTVGAVVDTGACCFPDGSCAEHTEAYCVGTGGIYHGDTTTCATTACPQLGACCIPSGCVSLLPVACDALGGEYRGPNTECATANCPPPTVGAIIGITWGGATTSPTPNNWTRIVSGATGSIPGLPDDLGNPTSVGIEWGGTGDFLFISTVTVAPDATPQYHYDLSGMAGYVFRSSGSGPMQMIFSGLTPNAEYEYWFVGYRAASSFEQIVQVSDGDTVNAINFAQTSGGGNRFIINDVDANSSMHFDALSFRTSSSSTGTLTFNLERTGSSATVIGAVAIREIFASTCYANCDGSTNEPILNVDDFTCFINEFAAAQALPHEQQVTHYANCDGSTNAPVLNVDDFTCFINEFAAGCP